MYNLTRKNFCEGKILRLYRYRSIQSALLELEDGSFYFADRNDLNDPIEGYIKVFWQGDKPAWEGLLKNFICSLFYSLQTYLLMTRNFGSARKNFYQDDQNRVVIINLQQFENSSLNQNFIELGRKFLSTREVSEAVDFYGGENIKCYLKELEFILRTTVEAACHLCVKKCKSLGLIPNDFDENFFDVEYEISFAELKNIEDAERKRKIDEIENLNCDAMESGLFALKLNPRDTADLNYELKQQLLRLKIFFPRMYAEQLKEIMYPNGYVVCFSETPTNSAMWGNYADNHRGICFVYETESIDGREYINFAAKPLEVSPIKYDARIIERNFFDTLRHIAKNFIGSCRRGVTKESTGFFWRTDFIATMINLPEL